MMTMVCVDVCVCRHGTGSVDPLYRYSVCDCARTLALTRLRSNGAAADYSGASGFTQAIGASGRDAPATDTAKRAF
jgi:hypothetical protein